MHRVQCRAAVPPTRREAHHLHVRSVFALQLFCFFNRSVDRDRPKGPKSVSPRQSVTLKINNQQRDVKIHVWKWSCALTSRLGAVLGRKGGDQDCGSRLLINMRKVARMRKRVTRRCGMRCRKPCQRWGKKRKNSVPNAGLNPLRPDSGCPLRAGTWHGRPGRAPGRCGCAVTSLLQRGGGGAVC